MRRARKFLSLSSPDKLLLIEAIALLTVVRLGLWVLPFRALWRLIVGMAKGLAAGRRASGNSERITWAVSVGSLYIPGATCLTQALTAYVLFARRGYPAQLRIGVAKDERGLLEAHAWVENEGKIVIGGGSDLSRYSLLPTQEVERA